MNRRHLLQSLATLGLVAATPEPVRRFWTLDQTMVDPYAPWNNTPLYHYETERYDASTGDWRKEFMAWQVRMDEIAQSHPWYTEGGITRISDDDVFERYDSRGDPFAITFVDGVYIKHPDHPTFNLIL